MQNVTGTYNSLYAILQVAQLPSTLDRFYKPFLVPFVLFLSSAHNFLP